MKTPEEKDQKSTHAQEGEETESLESERRLKIKSE